MHQEQEERRQSRVYPFSQNCVHLLLPPKIYVCKAGLGDCWLEHLAACGDEFIISDHSGEDIDGGVDFEI